MKRDAQALQRTVACCRQPLLVLAMLHLLGGCAAFQQKPEPQQDLEIVPAVPAISPVEAAEIMQLLEEAHQAIEEDRLTTPVEDNAYFRFLRVLAIDPANDEARFGIYDIVEKYLHWAIKAIERVNYRAAGRYLAIADDIDPEHPNIHAVRSQIEEAQSATSTNHRISKQELKKKGPELIAKLRNLGAALTDFEAMVTIRAPSDSDGRWIYQQLNDGSERRIRAELEIGVPPNIKVIFSKH